MKKQHSAREGLIIEGRHFLLLLCKHEHTKRGIVESLYLARATLNSSPTKDAYTRHKSTFR